MGKRILFFMILTIVGESAFSATNYMPKRFNTITSHDDVYPYVLNNTKTKNNKVSNSSNKTNSVSSAPFGKRAITKRQTNARVATTATTAQQTNTTNQRRVVQRTATPVRTATRNTSNNVNVRAATNNSTTYTAKPRVRTRTTTVRNTNPDMNYVSETNVSSQRCFADYKECMEYYCKREDTAYNRCYCSAKLAQIDAKYQHQIDDLIQQIVRLQYNSETTSDDIKDYWDKNVSTYTGDNPWVNIDNALNIEWADTESRVNGQNAFNTGHEYCVQHLRGCYYMATNMRDAYKSEIARDCKTYETGLQKIKDAAESVIDIYGK